MRSDWARLASRWVGFSRFVALLAVPVAIALTQSEWTLTLGVLGFLFLIVGWVGMYFQVKKTDPDHPVAKATYIGTLTAIRLIIFHWKRHGMDLWMALVTLGVGPVVIAIVRFSFKG